LVDPAQKVARKEQILALRADGLSDREIAARMGVSLKVVETNFYRMRRAGVAVPPAPKQRHKCEVPQARADGTPILPWNDEAEAELIDLYGQGLELVDIAAQMGRSRKSVSVHMTRLRAAGKVSVRRNASPHAARWSPERQAQLRALWPKMTPTQIAGEMGLSRGAVSGMANRMGLGPVSRDGAAAQPPAEQKSDLSAAPVAKAVPEPAPAPRPPVAAVSATSAPSGFVGQKGGALTANAARPVAFARPVAQVLTGMTQSEKEAAIHAHVNALPDAAGWDAGADLALCQAVFGGLGLPAFALDAGMEPHRCLVRFDQIVAPLREAGRKHLPIEAGSLLVPALRARAEAKRASGVAA
jgi:DNA-binding CsgD family transcriptional regulator